MWCLPGSLGLWRQVAPRDPGSPCAAAGGCFLRLGQSPLRLAGDTPVCIRPALHQGWPQRAWRALWRDTVPVARLELGLRTILRLSDFGCSWRSHSFGQSRGPSLRHSNSFFGSGFFQVEIIPSTWLDS